MNSINPYKIYNLTTNQQRKDLIKLVLEENIRLKEASKQLGLNYSTAKTILRVFKKEKRTNKKTLKKNKIFVIKKIHRRQVIQRQRQREFGLKLGSRRSLNRNDLHSVRKFLNILKVKNNEQRLETKNLLRDTSKNQDSEFNNKFNCLYSINKNKYGKDPQDLQFLDELTREQNLLNLKEFSKLAFFQKSLEYNNDLQVLIEKYQSICSQISDINANSINSELIRLEFQNLIAIVYLTMTKVSDDSVDDKSAFRKFVDLLDPTIRKEFSGDLFCLILTFEHLETAFKLLKISNLPSNKKARCSL